MPLFGSMVWAGVSGRFALPMIRAVYGCKICGGLPMVRPGVMFPAGGRWLLWIRATEAPAGVLLASSWWRGVGSPCPGSAVVQNLKRGCACTPFISFVAVWLCCWVLSLPLVSLRRSLVLRFGALDTYAKRCKSPFR